MTSAVVRFPSTTRSAGSRLLRAGLITGVIDGTWAIVLTMLYGRSVARLWQGVAAAPFGERMLDGGATTVALGILVHFGVAFAWCAVFLLLVRRLAWLRRAVESPNGALKVAAVYGPMIWLVMSAGVIPLFTGKPLVMTWRWWIQAAGPIVFVGLPIVSTIGSGSRRDPAT